MDSATPLPTRLRVLGTEYAVEQHKSVVYLVGPRGGQHALIPRMGTLRSDAFPGVRFALDLSSASKRGAAVPVERVEAPMTAREVALALQLMLGPEGGLLGAAVLTGSWHVLSRCVVMLGQGGHYDAIVRALHAVAKGAA